MKSFVPFKIAGIAVLIMMAESSAFALTTPIGQTVPASALSDQVSKALESQQQPTEARPTAPIEQPKEEKEGSPLGPEAEKIKFQLNGIVLEGNHVFSSEQLKPIYKDKLHKTITVAELFNIVQGITNYYRNSGYIISRAILPPQHVKNGVVRVQIIEGTLDQVDVAGDPRGTKCILKVYGNKIKECSPLQVSRMEHYLLIANELPGTQVRAVLSPSKTKTGAADLTLNAQNRAIIGYLSYDNYGTRYIGPQQITTNLGATSIFKSGDMAQFTYTKTPKGRELTFLDVNYGTVMTEEGSRWTLGGTLAVTHPLFVLQPSAIDGTNQNYYLNSSYPIIRSRSENLTAFANFNYMNSNTDSLGQKLYDDQLRSLGLGANYTFSDRWLGANLIYGDVRQGLPIFGYSNNYNPSTATTSRPGGRGDYTKIDVQLSRLQAIQGPVSLYGLFKGQWAFNPLLASEQFAYGGSQLGRGYDPAEIIGDKGLGASLELRYDLGIGKFYIQSMQPYVFYDGGVIWNFKHIGGVPTRQSALSTGIGTRFYLTKYISGNVMWAQPITKPVAALQATNQAVVGGVTENRGNGDAPRVFFSVVFSFA